MTTTGRIFLCAILIAGLSAGCKKKEAPAAAIPTAPAETNPQEAAVPASPPSPRGPVSANTRPATPAVIQDSANTDSVLNQLTMELRNYVMRTRSVPKTFEEFAAKSMVQAPAAPAGKKYAINNHAVVLVQR